MKGGSIVRLVIVCLMGLLLPSVAAAAMPDVLQQKVQALARESDGIAKQRHKWETVQQALLAQKKQIEATQEAVMNAQDTLNQRSVSHNQQVAAQQEALKKNESGCRNGGEQGSGHVDDCDKDIKDLNQKTGALDSDVGSVESEQAKLDAQYAQANQDASDWNAHESLATQHLNEVYRAGNDWLDRAYEVITDQDFRDEVTATGSDASCENRGLPAGKLSIPTLVRLSEAYRKCLKTVLSAELRAPAPPPRQPTSSRT
jgi:chromosome segregation ATPase